MYIAEAGFAYAGLVPAPRILKVDNQREIFIAEFGIMLSISHLPVSVKYQEREIVGQKVVMLNPQSKNYSDFYGHQKISLLHPLKAIGIL